MGAEHHLYFVLYGDHLMFFGDQTLQAPKTFAYNYIHEVSEFYDSFFYFFEFTIHSVGAPKLDVVSTFLKGPPQHATMHIKNPLQHACM